MRRVTVVLVLMAFVAVCGDDGGTASTVTRATTSSEVPTTESSTTTTTTTTDATTTTGGTIRTPAHTAEDAARAILTVDGTRKQACDDLVTDAFIAITYGSKKSCFYAHRPAALATSIRVVSSKKTVNGVHLVVVPDGGPYDGAKVEVEVLGVPNAFYVDSLQAHVPAGP